MNLSTDEHCIFLDSKITEVQHKILMTKLTMNDFPNLDASLRSLRRTIQKLEGVRDKQQRLIFRDQLEDCSEQLTRIVK